MAFQGFVGGKAFVTHCAQKAIRVVMVSHVLLQIAGLRVPFATDRAHVRALPRMDPDMRMQIPKMQKPLAARLAKVPPHNNVRDIIMLSLHVFAEAPLVSAVVTTVPADKRS